MRSVCTYTDLSTLKDAPYYEAISDCIHVGVSEKFNRRMQEEDYFQNVVSFNQLLYSIDADWKSDDNKMLDLTLISEYINKLILKTTDQNKRVWLSGCLKRAFSIWSAVALLEETDTEPIELNGSPEVQLMRDIWNHLLRYDRYFARFRENMANEHAAACLKSKLEKVCRNKNCNTVILHGFYYITPIQERILRILEYAGYDIVFLFPYDPYYVKTNEIWDSFYSASRVCVDKSSWNMYGSHVSNAFSEAMDGRNSSANGIQLTEYGSVMDFVRDLDASDDGFSLYSPNEETANEILGDFFPEKYGSRNIMSYPIGSFICTLHKMWDNETQSIFVSPDSIYDCFASGWISYDGHRSNEYLHDLMDLMPFFKDCSTVPEWNRRLNLLSEIKRDVISKFTSESEDPDVNRWENVLKNPFSNFSMFDVEPKRLDIVVHLISELLNYAIVLFNSDEERTISEHINILISYIKENCGESESMVHECDVAIAALSNMHSKSNNLKFDSNALSAAIIAYSGIPVNETSDYDSLTNWVLPLSDINSKTAEKLHVCLCDLKSLPGGRKSYVWPLNPGLIDSIIDNQSKDGRIPLLDYTRFIVTHGPAVERYLLSEAFRCPDLKLSWISVMNDKSYSPSPYISILSELADAGIERTGSIGDDIVSGTDGEHSCNVHMSIDLSDEKLIPEARMECSLCVLRYIYSYVLDENPTYSSEFLQSFSISGLISALEALQKEERIHREDIRKNVFELFPELRDVEKQNICDLMARTFDSGTYMYNKWTYTNHRHDVRFAAPIRGTIEERMLKLQTGQMFSRDTIEPDVHICRYCPHSDYCMYSKFQDGDN